MTNDGEDITYVHADHLGSPQKMTDKDRSVVWDASFLPFGEEHSLTGSAANDNRFPGQRLESETGLHYNYYRDYDPSTGRYLQSDPIGLAGGINTYGYVSGNPLRYVDPRGLNPVAGCAAGVWAGPIGCGVGAVIVGGISFGAIMFIPGDVPINDSIEENFCRLPDTFYSDNINEPEAEDPAKGPLLPDDLLGDNVRDGSGNRKNTDLPGGEEAAEELFDKLSGGTGKPDPENPDHTVGENGVRLRPGKNGDGPRVDIPAKGMKPHETIHF